MSYNTGNFYLFQQSGVTSSTKAIAESIAPLISSPGGVSYQNVYGYALTPSILSQGAASFYGLSISLSMSASSQVVSQATSLFIQGPTVSSGWLGTVYSLFVADPSTSGTGVITNSSTAYIEGATGIGTTVSQNMLDVAGSVAIGSFAGTVSALTNSVIVSGAVGVGIASPNYTLDAQGLITATRVLTQDTTFNSQIVNISQGYAQSGSGGGAVGTQTVFNSLTTIDFDMKTVNGALGGYWGAVFDGRYIYPTPAFNGILVRYDTTLNFTSSLSYTIYNTALLSPLSSSFLTSGFDGRYIYFVAASAQTQITRYDTTLSFTSGESYAFFNVTLNIPNDGGSYVGTVFDGRYMYFPSNSSNTLAGNLLRYDTYSPFSSSTSYSLVNLVTFVNSLAGGYFGSIFDGRYLYLAPNSIVGGRTGGLFVQYDTTAPFTAASSYKTFDISPYAFVQYEGGVFDGRYVYFCPVTNEVVRYDTTLPFTASTSYAIVLSPTGIAQSLFDGRYIYFDGQMYDTILPFDSSLWPAYTISAVNVHGGISDGHYGYFFSSEAASALVSRINLYAAPPVTSLVIGSSLGDFTVSSSLSLLVNTAGSASAGSNGAMPSLAAGFLWVNINGQPKRIVYF